MIRGARVEIATSPALLRLYGAHNWDCTLKTRRGSFDSSNE